MSRISTSESILSYSDQQNIIKTTSIPATPPMTLKNSGRWVVGETNRAAGAYSFRLPRSSSKFQAVKFLRRLGAKLAKAMRMMSMRKQRSSRKVSSSSSPASLVRSRSCADPITDNSHRAEAIGDCIEFLNSSSLNRSSSVSSSCA